MKINETISGIGPVLPNILNERIQLLITGIILPEEISLFNLAFSLVAEYIHSGNAPVGDSRATIAIIDRDILSINFNEDGAYGNFVVFIFYPIHKWRTNNLSDLQILTCIVEELCHYLWCINDELAVKYRVAEVMMPLSPHISVSRLYPGLFPHSSPEEPLD